MVSCSDYETPGWPEYSAFWPEFSGFYIQLDISGQKTPD